jgi:uncharacterized membrane protein YfcA
MDTQTIIILILIGLSAGVLSGFVGIGGGVIIVPALIYVIGMSQYQAQGTSLFVLLLPVGLFAVQNYWKHGYINWRFGLIIALTFFAGGYLGSKLALRINPAIVKLVFGALMAYVSIKMIMSGLNTFSDES